LCIQPISHNLVIGNGPSAIATVLSVEKARMRVPKLAWIVGVALIASTIAFWLGSIRLKLAVHRSELEVPSKLPAAPPLSAIPASAGSGVVSKSEPEPQAVAPPPPVGMVLIRAGTFMMGSNNGHHNEKPVHRVTLSAFYLDKHEVTVKEYRRCVAAGKCEALDDPAKLFSHKYCNGTHSDRQNHPMNCVARLHALQYCEWVGKRLPTEAEWEYSARGTEARTYPWGEEAPNASRAVVEGIVLDGRTEPVCSKPAGNTPEGACDLAGNVWEWVSDWYGAYSSEVQTDPRGPEQGTARVFRGGSWLDTGSVRASLRGEVADIVGNLMFGFRCARGIAR
jgi:eukaryotic-like serine/threonine-protein kinase